jgi:hypothetical protein
MVAASPLRRAAPGHLVLRPPDRSITSSGSSIARAISAAPAGSIVRSPMFRNGYGIGPGRRSSVAMHSAHASKPAGSRQDHLRAMWRSTPDKVGSSTLAAAPRHINSADTLPISRSIRSHQPQRSAAGQTFTSTHPEITLRALPPPPSVEARAEQNSGLNLGTRSAGTRPDPGRDVQRQTNRSTSTVHLDGATLGQWTIQHLERVLAKPAAGMTGVDPRASLPRGRVSPF